MLLAGTDQTDEVSHQMLGLITPTAPDGTANPYYDRIAGTGPRDNRVAQRLGYIRGAYHSADDRLGLVRSLIGSDSDILASSDHGFAPQWYAVDAALPLKQLGLQDVEQTCNCRRRQLDRHVAKACWAGATAQIYLNLKGRGAGTRARPGRSTRRRCSRSSTRTGTCATRTPARRSSRRCTRRRSSPNVEGSDSLNPTRSGDVVVVTKVPYEFDAQTVGTLVAPSRFFGQHGYLPDDVDLAHNINMHATFVAGGPDIVHDTSVEGVRAVDLAPTLAVLGGFNPPLQAQGRVLTEHHRRRLEVRDRPDPRDQRRARQHHRQRAHATPTRTPARTRRPAASATLATYLNKARADRAEHADRRGRRHGRREPAGVRHCCATSRRWTR